MTPDTGPAYSMGIRRETGERIEEGPAPGEYQAPALPSMPAFTIGKAKKELGQVDVSNSYNSLLPLVSWMHANIPWVAGYTGNRRPFKETISRAGPLVQGAPIQGSDGCTESSC